MSINLERVREILTQETQGINNEDVLDTVQLLLDKIDKHNMLDHDFLELLQFITNEDGSVLHQVQKYPAIVNSLDIDSTVIYFKSAGVFRVYSGEELEQHFVNRIRTNYKNHDAIYEVVRDEKPQKIVIIIDSRDKLELNKVKQYIVAFSKKIGVEVSIDDLATFDNTYENTYEIVINSWTVSNRNKRESIKTEFRYYLDVESQSNELSNKIKNSNYIGIPGTIGFMVPQKKILISNHDHADGYVTKGVDINLVDDVHVPMVNRLKSIKPNVMSDVLSIVIYEAKIKMNKLMADGKFNGHIDLAVYLEPTLDKTPNVRDQYVYLIQEREFKNLAEPVYKIGRTTQKLHKRMNAYPKNSKHFASKAVHDCVKVEKLLIEQFDRLFKKRSDIGREYYEGSVKHMISAFDMITQLNIDI